MSDNTDHNKVMSEAIATIPPWRSFIQRKKAEVQAQVAQMQAQPSSANASTVVTDSLDAETDAEQEANAGHSDPATDSDATDTPASALALRFTPSPSPTAAPSMPFTNVSPAPASSSAATQLEMLPASEPPKAPTLEEAQAALDAALAGTQILTLPVTVQAAWQDRQNHPALAAQGLVGVVQAGKVAQNVRHAVALMVQVDPHFQQANRLLGMYPAMFKVNDDAPLEEEVTEDEGAGEADQGTEDDDSPF
jgi:hypothetical protein